jgi:hypothetical protein
LPKNSDEPEVAGTFIFSFETYDIFAEGNGGGELSCVSGGTGSSPFMANKGDPFSYVAKYVTKQGGDLHFGGTLQNVNFSEFTKSRNAYGRKQVVRSANVDSRLFHMNNPRRKK